MQKLFFLLSVFWPDVTLVVVTLAVVTLAVVTLAVVTLTVVTLAVVTLAVVTLPVVTLPVVTLPVHHLTIQPRRKLTHYVLWNFFLISIKYALMTIQKSIAFVLVQKSSSSHHKMLNAICFVFQL